VTNVPIEEVACQIAVSGTDDQAESVLRPETRAAIENAEADAERVDQRRVVCTVDDARDLCRYFDHVAATLQLAGDYERSTACAQAAERIRRVLDGPVLT
jgi:hypothetical protein